MKAKALKYQLNDHLRDLDTPGEQDPVIQEDMVLKYSPLIKFVAHRLAMRLPTHISVQDLTSAGVIGLMDALSKYDPNKGVEFKTYAEFRIRGAMLDELRAMDWVPRSVRQKATRIERTILHLENKMGRPVEEEEVAGELGISLEDYYNDINEINGLPILDREMIQNKVFNLSGEDILDFLLDEEENDPFHQLSFKELKGVLAMAIEELPHKEKLVISLYYFEELTLKEIGEVLQLTESRICQIHTKVILRLRAKLRRYLMDAL